MRPREVEPHFATFEQQEGAAQLGMWIFLATEVLFFGVLFASYALYRALYFDAFKEGAGHMDVALGTANTFILITSSLCVVLAIHLIQAGREGLSSLALWAAVALGAAFLAVKGVEYAAHVHEGALPGQWYRMEEAVKPGMATWFTLYWVMTGLHAVHVGIGVFVLAWMAVRVAAGAYSAESHTGVEIAGLYWHFVDVVWVFLYPLLYLI